MSRPTATPETVGQRPGGLASSQKVTLPVAPTTASPVPWLTSIHSAFNRGPWGAPSYRGNCGGYLIKDLLQFFGARSVLDPMAGSGTCRDVCRELDIPCTSFDLAAGQDAGDPAMRALRQWTSCGFTWRMIRYNDDPQCLSNAPSLEAFLDRLAAVLRSWRAVLNPGGHIAILIGGYHDRADGNRQIPLPALSTARAIEEGFWPACTEIIRFQHGNTSSRKSYRSRFIPGLHDVCIVLQVA